MSQEQVAAGEQTFVQIFDDASPSLRVEIDQDVPTQYDIDAADDGPTRRVEQIELAEVAESSDRIRDMGPVRSLVEVRTPDLGSGGAEGAGAIYAATRRRDYRLTTLGWEVARAETRRLERLLDQARSKRLPEARRRRSS